MQAALLQAEATLQKSLSSTKNLPPAGSLSSSMSAHAVANVNRTGRISLLNSTSITHRHLSDKWLAFDRIACLLCQRKFLSPDLLCRHSEESKLHKRNLQVEGYKQIHREMQAEKRKRMATYEMEKEKEKESRIYPECDWLCGRCEGLNFSRRTDCYSCGHARGDDSIFATDPKFLEYRRGGKRRRTVMEAFAARAGVEGDFAHRRTEEDEREERRREREARHKLTHSNVGHGMLKKMGWNEDSGLGKSSQGIREPISADGRKFRY